MCIRDRCLLRLGGYNGESEQVAADLVTAVRQRAFKSDPGKATVTVAQLKGCSRYNYGHRENQGIMGEADNWIITEAVSYTHLGVTGVIVGDSYNSLTRYEYGSPYFYDNGVWHQGLSLIHISHHCLEWHTYNKVLKP